MCFKELKLCSPQRVRAILILCETHSCKLHVIPYLTRKSSITCTCTTNLTGFCSPTAERMAEDCLSLNVFVPRGTEKDSKKAVMVWIFGGAFAIGAAKEYNGTVLSAFNDIIVVSINYQVGVFGFLNIPGTEVKGNYGIYDQVRNSECEIIDQRFDTC